MFFSAAASWAVYKGELREAIHALKFRQDLALGEFFSKFLIQLLDKTNWDFDMVIPVPLSRTRLKERTFNQSALLSRPIAAYYSVEHSQSPLKRIIDTGSQVSRTRVERNNALEDAFLGNPAKLKGRKVLLVDDIITTGATINHCASALKQAGAHEVFAISVAKTPKTNKVRDIDRLPDQNILFGGNNG
jgi:ComF family protein